MFQKFIGLICLKLAARGPAAHLETTRGSRRERTPTRQGRRSSPSMPGSPMDAVENLPPPPPGKQKVSPPDADAPPPPPSKVAEKGEVAAAIQKAQVATVKEEAVQQGEQDIDKVYKFRDAILEGATALNIETKAELVELFTKSCIEST